MAKAEGRAGVLLGEHPPRLQQREGVGDLSTRQNFVLGNVYEHFDKMLMIIKFDNVAKFWAYRNRFFFEARKIDFSKQIRFTTFLKTCTICAEQP